MLVNNGTMLVSTTKPNIVLQICIYVMRATAVVVGITAAVE